ncbi:MAG: histidine phosphatase family protein [Clostridia bacterium]|nr:histidine phosphatase family protein [Clostridia bacterium]
MELLIVRHGKTVWNEQKRTQGRVHNRLCKEGILFSQKTAEELKNVKIDYIFSSPLLRSVQTANIINKYHNKKIIKDERLTDIDQGVFTGRYFESLTQQELQIKLSKDKNYGMESLQEMFIRVNDFFEFLKKNYLNSTILIVTHSGVARMVELSARYGNFSSENFDKTDTFQNAEIRKIVIM